MNSQTMKKLSEWADVYRRAAEEDGYDWLVSMSACNERDAGQIATERGPGVVEGLIDAIQLILRSGACQDAHRANWRPGHSAS